MATTMTTTTMTNGNKRDRTRDGYGFVVPTPYVSLFRDYRRVYAVEEEQRNRSWRRWVEGYGGCLATALDAARVAGVASSRGDASTSGGSGVPHHELGVLVKTMGVPREMRRQVWLDCLVEEDLIGGEESGDRSRRMTMSYEGLVGQMEGATFADDLQQIEKDLHRTFPNHALTNGVWGKARLRRVLGAYAVRNPKVGYCQGLNFLAAMFLLVFGDGDGGEGDGDGGDGGEGGEGGCIGKEEEKRGDEQDGAEEVRGDGRSGPLVGYSPNRGGAAEAAAFWCFTALVEQILTGYFDPMMINQQVDGLVFEQLVREVLPDVAAHFDDVGVHVPTVCRGSDYLAIAL